MSYAPAVLAGFEGRAGTLEAGREANFVVFDPDATRVVTEDQLYYRHRISPYLGETLRGVVRATYLRGKAVFREGLFAAGVNGRYVSEARR